MRRFLGSILLGMLLPWPVVAAPPIVPTSLPYQGLLLDGLGEPRTGSVDLTVRIHDAVVGGTLVYKQSFPAVALADGVFTVQLGPSGEGTDSPTNPLTTDLATALAGDAGATAPLRFLEMTVGGDGALARTQILASAYAVRSSSAANADTATVASVANDVANVNGVGSSFVSEIFQHFAFDGSNPPNDDPSEGLGDTDGDGVANFMDSDNDNDLFGDATELSQGTDINLRTPNVTSVAPGQAFLGVTTNVTINGTSFEPGLTLAFGTQTPTPTSVTSTSFQALVGPQAGGPVNVTVTLPNGQVDTLTNGFTFSQSAAHAVALAGPNVSIATRTGTPVSVLGGSQQYGVGTAVEAVYPLASKGGSAGRIAVAFDPSGRVAGLRCRDTGGACVAEVLVDGDADDALEDETGAAIETVPFSTAGILAANLEYDAAGRPAVGYLRYDPTVDAAVAHDRNGDGDFADANEVVTIETGLASFGFNTSSGLAVDAANRLAFVFTRAIDAAIRVAWDRSGDGDFGDTVGANAELATLATGNTNCIGAAFDALDRLAVIYTNSLSGTSLARDLNADGDFADASEIQSLTPSIASGCDVVNRTGHAFAAAYSVGAVTTLLVDANEDGDFADGGESTTITGSSSPLGLALNGTNQAIIGTVGSLRFGNAN